MHNNIKADLNKKYAFLIFFVLALSIISYSMSRHHAIFIFSGVILLYIGFMWRHLINLINNDALDIIYVQCVDKNTKISYANQFYAKSYTFEIKEFNEDGSFKEIAKPVYIFIAGKDNDFQKLKYYTLAFPKDTDSYKKDTLIFSREFQPVIVKGIENEEERGLNEHID